MELFKLDKQFTESILQTLEKAASEVERMPIYTSLIDVLLHLVHIHKYFQMKMLEKNCQIDQNSKLFRE